MRIDLNADVGEAVGGAGQDARLIPLITSANIACGVHGGSLEVMRRTVTWARRHHVAIGAHPGLPDPEGFGRRDLHLPPAAIERLVTEQVRSLTAVAAADGARVQHVKPHGALYNMAARDPVLAAAVARAVATVDDALVLFGPPGSALIEAGNRAGLRTAAEAFADRAYRADGTLVPRSEAGALVTEPDQVAARALGLVRDHCALTLEGERLSVRPDTICIHGDTPGAVELAARVRAVLAEAGVRVVAVGAP